MGDRSVAGRRRRRRRARGHGQHQSSGAGDAFRGLGPGRRTVRDRAGGAPFARTLIRPGPSPGPDAAGSRRQRPCRTCRVRAAGAGRGATSRRYGTCADPAAGGRRCQGHDAARDRRCADRGVPRPAGVAARPAERRLRLAGFHCQVRSGRQGASPVRGPDPDRAWHPAPGPGRAVRRRDPGPCHVQQAQAARRRCLVVRQPS